MKPSALIDSLKICMKANKPTMTWGNPGICKSQVHQQLADWSGRKLFDVRFSGRDQVDFLGLPHIDADNFTAWATPKFLPKPSDGPSILFLDEINRGTQQMLNLGLQLVLDRRCGDYFLPSDCLVMAAGNYETDPGVIRMSGAMRLRFAHFDVEADAADWRRWAVDNGIEPEVIAFMSLKEELLDAYDAKARTSPNPRNWVNVSNVLRDNPDAPVSVIDRVIEGYLGKGPAVEFSGFRRLFHRLPSVEAIALNPTTTQVPTNPSEMYAISAALARRSNPDNFGRFLTYLNRMPVEYNVLAVTCAAARNKDIANTKEFVSWSVTHQDIILNQN